VNVRDVLGNWPPATWTADDPKGGALTSDSRELRLLWFSAPDEDGWFRLTATDPRGASWSTYCRAPTREVWPPLERALGQFLKEPLGIIGDAKLESRARPKPTAQT
jgi:pimeloyl-ACP methyl ester carboxylesterase